MVRFKFTKKGKFKYLSHLDITRFIIRAIKRAGIEIEYSQGFNPKPKISFSNPTPLGVESYAEYADAWLKDYLDEKNFKQTLNRELKPELMITRAANVERKLPSLMKDIAVALYVFKIRAGENMDIDKLEGNILGEPSLKDSIYSMNIREENKLLLINLYGYAKLFKNKNNSIFKYNYFYDYFTDIIKNYNISMVKAIKKEMFIIREGNLKPPLEILEEGV